MIATYTSKDQNWQDETTIYWFEISGDDTVVDCDGSPCTEGDAVTIAVRKVAIVTDDMRMEQ